MEPDQNQNNEQPINQPAAPEANPVPPVVTAAPAPVVGQPADLPPTRRKFSFKSRTLLMTIGAAIIVFGGSAAAYVGVVLPNKPDNLLKTAINNTLQQTQYSYNGNFQISPVSGGGLATKATFTGSVNTAAKAVDSQLNLTVSGVTVPLEARLVSGNLYVKLGDLGTLSNLVKGFDPAAAGQFQSIAGQLSSKWIVVDSTLLDEAGASCYLNNSWSLTKADLQLLDSQYSARPFVTIESTGSDTVNGKTVEKMVLSVDDDKASTYVTNLKNLSVVKNAEKCNKNASSPLNGAITADHDKTPITVWIDKSSKRIVQISAHSTTFDAKTKNQQGSWTVTLNYQPTSITAPANAEPVTQLLASLESQFAGSGIDPTTLLGGLGGSGSLSQ